MRSLMLLTVVSLCVLAVVAQQPPTSPLPPASPTSPPPATSPSPPTTPVSTQGTPSTTTKATTTIATSTTTKSTATTATTTTTKATAATTTATTATTATTTVSSTDYVSIAKAYIAAGTCKSVVKGTCNTTAPSYYNTFTSGNYRYVITSGVPALPTADDSQKPNPNTRCQYWKFIKLPLSPNKTTTLYTTMGQMGWASSGGHVYNQLSNTNGTMAYYYEGVSLDTCGGHSDQSNMYHYHRINSTCITNAVNASACQLIGYMIDGFPLYGYCQTAGTQLKTCYKVTSGQKGDYWSQYYYDTAGYQAKTCHLDAANGYTFSDGSYGYVMTADVPYVPPYVYGSEISSSNICGM